MILTEKLREWVEEEVRAGASSMELIPYDTQPRVGVEVWQGAHRYDCVATDPTHLYDASIIISTAFGRPKLVRAIRRVADKWSRRMLVSKDLQSAIDEIRALPGEWVISDPAEGCVRARIKHNDAGVHLRYRSTPRSGESWRARIDIRSIDYTGIAYAPSASAAVVGAIAGVARAAAKFAKEAHKLVDLRHTISSAADKDRKQPEGGDNE